MIGNGGHTREVMAQMNMNLTRFVDDDYWSEGDEKVLPLSKFNSKEYKVMITIGDPKDRFNMSKKLPKDTVYFSFIHPTSIIMDSNIEIGEGSFVGAHSILTTNIKVGKHSILNRSNHIGHDCSIGDFLSLMPGSIISGNVNIGNRVYIGTNSTVKEKIKICDDVIIGLNSGVVKDIDQPGIYGGLPCKLLKTK